MLNRILSASKSVFVAVLAAVSPCELSAESAVAKKKKSGRRLFLPNSLILKRMARKTIMFNGVVGARFFALLAMAMALTVAGCETKVKAKTESFYQQKWCAAHGGETEFRLPGGERVDCLLDEYAAEFDWAKGGKVYECIGQAQFYAAETNRRPLCILIQKSGQSDKAFRRHAKRALTAAKPAGVEVRCLRPDGGERRCDSE